MKNKVQIFLAAAGIIMIARPGFSTQSEAPLPSLLDIKELLCQNDTVSCYKPLPDVTDGIIYHFLLIGSSNMMGRAMLRHDDSIPDPQVISVDIGYGGWKNTVEPSMPGMSISGKGPALSFGKKYAQMHPDRYVGLLCCGEGGMGLTAWSTKKYGSSSAWGAIWGLADDGTPSGVNLIDHAVKQGYHKWGGLVIKALPFGGTSGTYEKNLKKIIDSVRIWLNEPNLPVVVPEPAPFEIQDLGIANGNVWMQVVHDMPGLIPNTAYIKTDDCKSLLESAEAGITKAVDCTTHFDYASNVKMGERMAEAFTLLETSSDIALHGTLTIAPRALHQNRLLFNIGSRQQIKISEGTEVFDIRGRSIDITANKRLWSDGVLILNHK